MDAREIIAIGICEGEHRAADLAPLARAGYLMLADCVLAEIGRHGLVLAQAAPRPVTTGRVPDSQHELSGDPGSAAGQISLKARS